MIENTLKGYAEAKPGDGVYLRAITKKRGTVQRGMAQTIKAGVDTGVVVDE